MYRNLIAAIITAVFLLAVSSDGFTQTKPRTPSTSVRKVTPRPVKVRTPVPARSASTARRTPVPRRTPAPRRSAAIGKPGMVLPKAKYMIKIAPSFKLVNINEEFSQKISVKSMADGHFDQVSFSLKFDPQILAVADISDSAIKGNLAQPIDVFYDNVSGVITCTAFFKAKQKEIWELISIKWKALESGKRTKVQFNNESNQNELFFNGERVSDHRPGAPKWLLGGMVHTRSEDLNPKLNIWTEESLSSIKNDAWEIRITPAGELPAVGEIWKVDLEWSNPDLQDLRTINLKLGFDPGKFRVLDSDKKNWIRRGVNIWDGFARAKFPFDCHMRNEVDETTGMIKYWMGYQRPYATSSGKFARVYLGVLSEDADVEDIWIDELDIQ